MEDSLQHKRDRHNQLRRDHRKKKKEAVQQEEARQLLADAEMRATALLKEAEEESMIARANAATQRQEMLTREERLEVLGKQISERELVIKALEAELQAVRASVVSSMPGGHWSHRACSQSSTEELIALQQKRTKDARRKRASYWKSKNLQIPVLDAAINRRSNISLRRAYDCSKTLVGVFQNLTRLHNVQSQRLVLQKFFAHRSLKHLLPTLSGSKADKSIAAALVEMRKCLRKVNGGSKKDHLATQQAVLTSMAGHEVVANRHQASLARALNTKRGTLQKARKRRALLDADSTLCWPSGEKKTRSDKLCDKVRKIVDVYWETNTRVSPNKKDKVRLRMRKNVYEYHPVHWLEDTEVEFFLRFKEWCIAQKNNVRIGLRSFQNLKPFYIRTMKDRNVCCCKQHVEMDLLKEALNKFRVNSHPQRCICKCPNCADTMLLNDQTSQDCSAAKATIKSVREWCEQIVCPKEEGQQWHRRDCIKGECEECGIDKLKTCPVELDPETNFQIRWQEFQYVVLDPPKSSRSKKARIDQEKKKPEKRLRLLYKETSMEEFIDKIRRTMPAFVLHNFRARWQNQAYRRCLATFPRGTVVSSIDFAENYAFKVQNEVQSQHWDNKQITLLVHCTYRHRDNSPTVQSEESVDERDIVADYHFYISDDNEHDTLFVQHCLDKHWKWMKDEGIRCDHHIMWSDGCAAQFKACRPFFFVSRYATTYGVPLTWCFHASGHGKGINDGLGGTIKTAWEREELKGTTNGHKLQNAHDAVEFCKKKFARGLDKEYGGIQEARRFFWEIGENEVNRQKRWACGQLKGTRDLHCFRGFSHENPTLLLVRELACWCVACFNEDYASCENKAHAGEWTLESLVPEDQTFMQPFVDALGTGEGVHEEVESASKAEWINVGDFFASEAFQPNEWNVDFFIMQCTQLVSNVKRSFTDEWGQHFRRGDTVIQGLWYQKWGKRDETCYILHNKSPCFLKAGSVVHSRFLLNSTGLKRGAKSFSLPFETLEAIRGSLKSYGSVEIHAVE